MTLGVYIILGILILLIACIVIGLFIGKHDKKMDFKLVCKCGSDDFEIGELHYICMDCGTCIEK